jgi:Tfp pilus assembly protein PilO
MMRTVFSLAGLGLAVAIFLFYTQPTYRGVQSARAEITQYDQALDKAAELQKLKQTLLSRYNAFDPADIDRLHKLLPDHVDNVRLVLDLDNLAAKHGMALQNVVISNPEDAEQAQAVGTIGASKQKYGSLTLKFTTHSTYANFVTFMEDLETSLRIVDLLALSLAEDDQTGIGGGSSRSVSDPSYRYDITLKTYWLR